MKGGAHGAHGVPGKIRIIGGSLRNSRLDVPDLAGLRPTPARVRETLFNWLAPTIGGARCLDLCAGSGALGIEALSRGAASVQFVERDRAAVGLLRRNLERLGVSGGRVEQADAGAFLGGPAEHHDVVFIDPPFALQLWEPLATQLERGGWLADGAMIYVEAPESAVPLMPSNWQAHRHSRAGEVSFTLYRRLAPDRVWLAP